MSELWLYLDAKLAPKVACLMMKKSTVFFRINIPDIYFKLDVYTNFIDPSSESLWCLVKTDPFTPSFIRNKLLQGLLQGLPSARLHLLHGARESYIATQISKKQKNINCVWDTRTLPTIPTKGTSISRPCPIFALSLDMEWVTSLQLGGLEVATVVKFTISGHKRQLMFKGQWVLIELQRNTGQ